MKAKLRKFRQEWGPLVAFVVLAIAGGIALQRSMTHAQDTLYTTQIQICHRQNDLRRESNKRIPAHRADTDALRNFLVAAKRARISDYHAKGLKSDLQAAQTYQRTINTLDAKVHFQRVPIIPCQRVIGRP